MTGEFPALSRVFVEERDTFLIHSLKVASASIPYPDRPEGEFYNKAFAIKINLITGQQIESICISFTPKWGSYCEPFLVATD